MDGKPRARQHSIRTLVGDHGGGGGWRADGITTGRGAHLRAGRHGLVLTDCARDVLSIFIVHNGCFHCVIFSLCSSIPINCALQKLNVEKFQVRLLKQPMRCMDFL